MSRPRAVAVGVVALALLVSIAVLVPRGGDREDALRPSSDRDGHADRVLPANAVGASRVTPAMRAEIDRVVAAGSSNATKAGLAKAQAVRCAELDGQRYCLGVGWTDDTEAEVRSRFQAAAATRRTGATTTGDLDAAATLARAAAKTPAERAADDRAELIQAARSVAKVWLLRHELQGVALPEDFLDEHPEARASATTAAASSKPASAYPGKSTVIGRSHVTAQQRTYWCGPTSMQMIAWGWDGERRSQRHWAKRLGTTSDGTSITDMVRVVNRDTGWDGKDRAGRYISLDIGDWSFRQWMLLMMRHIHDYRAPVVLHPVLLERYYPYLAGDASGHFQVGRGYDKNGKRPLLLGYFEPWNQQRFDPSEPSIARVQWRPAYQSYRANQDHFQHNIGV